MRSLPTVLISVGVLAFVAWIFALGLHAGSLYADQPPSTVPDRAAVAGACLAGAPRAQVRSIAKIKE